MKAWKPCPASPGLRDRIFAPEARESAVREERFEWAGAMRWLIPAMSCLVILSGPFGEHEMQIPATALQPLEHQRLAFSAADGHSGWNNLPATTVEWTFGSPSSNSSGSFNRTETNWLSK